MYGLFVSLHNSVGLESPHIYLFPEETVAVHFAVRSLVLAGVIHHENGAYLSEDRLERWGTAEEALEAFQEWLNSSEYFHVYKTTTPGKSG